MDLHLDAPPATADHLPKPRLAQRVAAEIERDIKAGVRQVGESLGGEKELVARYGVSRSVLREALTLVAWSGLAEMRRGKSGGLIITAPSEAMAAAALQSYLDFVVPDFDALLTIRRELEEMALGLAIQRVTPAELPRLATLEAMFAQANGQRAQIAAGAAVFKALGAVAHNPLLSLLLAALSGLTTERLVRGGAEPDRLMADASAIAALRREQLAAVLAASPGRALAASAQAFGILAEMAAAPRVAAADADAPAHPADGGSAKLAQKVARRIRGRIVEAAMPPGTRLGSEMELMAAHGVSRGVIREAIRLLERLSVVKMVRGKGGGLQTLAPDPRRIVRSAGAYLRAVNLRQRHLEEVAAILGLAAAERAARVDPAAADRAAALLPDLDALRQATLKDVAFTYFELVRRLADGGAIGLTVDILADLYGLDEQAWAGHVTVKGISTERLADLADAVRAGQPDLARRRMVILQRTGAVVRSPQP